MPAAPHTRQPAWVREHLVGLLAPTVRSLGYDIEVATKSRRFMFEVKGTAEDGTEFELTESEVNAARRNRRRDAYRIIFSIDGETVNVLQVRHAARSGLR